MSDVDICNRALSRLGTQAKIATVDENTTEARTCLIWYAATRDTLLRAHDWSFARRSQQLIPDGPGSGGWLYRFRLPADCLRLLRLVEEGKRPAHFDVTSEGGVQYLLSDDPQPIAIYSARIFDVAAMPPAFQVTLVDQLAAHVAYPITQKTEIAVRLAQLARTALAEAMQADIAEAS